MNGIRLFWLIAVASFSGVLCSELLCRSDAFRDNAGRILGRGRLVAMSDRTGIYEGDLEGADMSRGSELAAMENLRRMAWQELPDAADVDREMSLLRAQFDDETLFLGGVRTSDFSISSLRTSIAEQLRSLQWLEKQIAAQGAVNEKACRDFYEAHPALFAQPVRFRASHIFLAAPADTPPEIVESKQRAINALAVRLNRGETLPQLAEEASEDEATKSRGGDMGFFSHRRMPSEFLAEIERLKVGQRSRPFRSHLGFHIVEVTEIRPERGLSFSEVKGSLGTALANERRALILKRLADMLGSATYSRLD